MESDYRFLIYLKQVISSILLSARYNFCTLLKYRLISISLIDSRLKIYVVRSDPYILMMDIFFCANDFNAD